MLKLNLETRRQGDVIVVSCQGRIVYREEAAALSRLVGQMLIDDAEQTSGIVLDLSGVTGMDGAGLGELAWLQKRAMQGRAMEQGASLKFAAANPRVRNLLGLTNLDRVIELHPSVDAALESFREQQLCASC